MRLRRGMYIHKASTFCALGHKQSIPGLGLCLKHLAVPATVQKELGNPRSTSRASFLVCSHFPSHSLKLPHWHSMFFQVKISLWRKGGEGIWTEVGNKPPKIKCHCNSTSIWTRKISANFKQYRSNVKREKQRTQKCGGFFLFYF